MDELQELFIRIRQKNKEERQDIQKILGIILDPRKRNIRSEKIANLRIRNGLEFYKGS